MWSPKAAITRHVTPDMIDHELPISLERLQTDYIDLYFLHRDNPAVPVGEFVDMFNRHRAAGRVRAFGGSNWTPTRLAEANAYAEHNGLAGFSASSPNFTLAVWNEVPYFKLCHRHRPGLESVVRRAAIPALCLVQPGHGLLHRALPPG